MSKPRVIAFYLPQFHSIPENDEWWGKGFTEWTNVGKAKPLFPGHRQPKVPMDLGYYDLRVNEVYDEQTKLAKEAGVEGFCFWHYYFGDGKQLLEKPLQRIVKESKNDFPFCLGWANEPWEKKLWNKDGKGNKVLIEQKYGGIEDYTEHFNKVLEILTDSRYIRIDNKPVFLIYSPEKLPNTREFIDCWNDLARKNGLEGIYFIAHSKWNRKEKDFYLSEGYDGVYSNEIQRGAEIRNKNVLLSLKYFLQFLFRFPRIVNFKEIIKNCTSEYDLRENIFPGIICGWDHTPRSGRKGMVIRNFNSKTFEEHIRKVFSTVENKQPQNKIVFLKSWNEWGEGNFMEPDYEFKHMKVDVLKKVMISM